MPPPFTPEALKFLRGLARHNDRAWFDPRKPIYERELKAPMLALIEQINHAFADFAPEHIRPPHKAMMRIYRDTRFDKSRGTPEKPYKTHIAAWWVRRGLEKTSGAGFYFSLSAKEVVIAAGMYMPSPDQLLAVRRYLVDHHAELRAILAGRKLRAAMQEFDGHKLTAPAARLLPPTRPPWTCSSAASGASPPACPPKPPLSPPCSSRSPRASPSPPQSSPSSTSPLVAARKPRRTPVFKHRPIPLTENRAIS